MRPGFPEVLGAARAEGPAAEGGAKSSGRRTALAEWVASKDNPLTARVFVNRVWQHHFGRGIVPSSNDFGKFGTAPTHPELLDWLAAEFVENGWTRQAAPQARHDLVGLPAVGPADAGAC